MTSSLPEFLFNFENYILWFIQKNWINVGGLYRKYSIKWGYKSIKMRAATERK
jgi:hypothetical protein